MFSCIDERALFATIALCNRPCESIVAVEQQHKKEGKNPVKSASRKEFPDRSQCKVNSLREPMLLGFFSPNLRLPGFTAQRYKSDSSSKEGRWGSITIFLPFALLPYVLLVSPIKGRNIAARPAWFALLWLNNSKKSHKITQIVQRVGTSMCGSVCIDAKLDVARNFPARQGNHRRQT